MNPAVTALAQEAQLATNSKNGYGIGVNIPSSTASGSSEQIFFSISAPSGTQWAAFGQGSSMSGSNMFIVYTSGDGNVTLSPRLGKGNVMPRIQQ